MVTSVTTTPVWVETTGEITGVILAITFVLFVIYFMICAIIGMEKCAREKKEYRKKLLDDAGANIYALKKIEEYDYIDRKYYILAPWKERQNGRKQKDDK